MTNFFYILTILFSLQTLAYDYNLIEFYDGKTHTEEEMLKFLGVTKSDLIDYKCDNPTRYDLFTEYKAPNKSRNSLLFEDLDGAVYIYKNGKFRRKSFFKRFNFFKRKSSFYYKALKALQKIESTPTGSLLISYLQKSPYKLIIAKGRPHFNPTYDPKDRTQWRMNEATFAAIFDIKEPLFPEKIPLQRIGAGGKIFWSPSAKSLHVEEDNKKRRVAPEIVLAHEMYHAYDSVRGLLDRRFVQSDELEFIGVLEYRATYIENLMRKELGHKYRKFYSEVTDMSAPGLLDQNGSPILLPSPCITWL